MKLSKLTIFSLVFLVAPAFAEVRYQVAPRMMNYERGMLELEYSMGGGCQKHKTEFRVELAQENQRGDLVWVAHVIVEDVSPAPDYCEAMFDMKGSANVRDLVQRAMKAKGLPPQLVQIVLPRV